ncbi:MAG: S41 family peptidase [Ginsengibacter sp.]
MKHIAILVVNVFSFVLFSFGQHTSLFFTSYPTLTPDGHEVIFSYDGNLWSSSIDGSNCNRITAMQGSAIRPRVSPNGKWIAFSNSQFGNQDIYVMPVNGGDIKRLTFHSANDLMESWSWNSDTIYFTSNRYDRMASYKIALSGGTPARVFGNDFFDYTHDVVTNPVTNEIFFDDTWESSNFYNRIGYKGPFNPEIQSYNFKTKKHKNYTNWEGKDMWASFDKNGKLYFISDEANGKYNLYTFVNDKKTQLTNFTTSVMRPFVNVEGTKVVFEKDFQLYSYDVATKKSGLIPLKVNSNNTLAVEQNFNVSNNISDFDVSDDGKKMVFVSRGKLFVSDVKGKFIRQIKTREAERAEEVYWLKDNQTILYGGTDKGFENFFTQDAEGNNEPKQITNDRKNNRSLAFNSDKTKATYLSGSNELKILDLGSMQSSLIVKDEFWAIQSSNPSFSPDDKYVMYTAYRNFEQDIFLYRLADKQIFNITNTGVSELGPVWSPDGKYIYFTSDRVNPTYPYGPQNAKVYRMALQKIDDPYKSDMFDSLFVKTEKNKLEKDDNKKEDLKDQNKKEKENKDKEIAKKPDVPKPVVTIDFSNLMNRLEEIGPSFGNQGGTFVIKDGEKTNVLFISNHENGKQSLWQMVYEPFEKTKTEEIKGGDRESINIKGYKDHYYTLAQGNIQKLKLDSKSLEKIELNYTFSRNMKDEFNQMFYEAWGVLQENYYDLKFNGVDWESVKKEYASFLPYLKTREDFRVLLNNMMGELNSSHYGFSTFGSDESTFYKTSTAANGIMFSNEFPYRVDHIIEGGVSDFEKNKILSGDELISVDGKRVDNKMNREYYFMGSSVPDEMTLGFKRGQEEYTVKIHPTVYNVMQGQLYQSWVNEKRQLVNKIGKGKIGYVYMKDMSGPSLDQFQLDMVSDSVCNKDALILDLRYNTGGNVHDKVLQFLSQRPYLQWKYRDGKMSPQPTFAPAAKPIILLVNEQTLSDGEMTAAGFKELKLGTIVGTGTYRWIIFTSGASLVDGSTVRLPSWGCFTLDGKNLERTGVTPDIFVKNTFEDRVNNKDPQIERAVQEILKQLK